MTRKPILWAAGALGLGILQPLTPLVVVGDSMAPIFHSGEVTVTTKYVGKIHPGDVVVFQRNNERMIKRVAFVGGDRFKEYTILNNTFIPQNEMQFRYVTHHKVPSKTVCVPEGQIYVLGDNLSVSVDSRTYGPIKVKDVIGKVLDSRGGADEIPVVTDAVNHSGQSIARL